jgi:hypothetical protein
LHQYPAFFGFIGVFVGAVITFGFNYYLYRKKFEADKDFYEQKRKDDISFKLVDQYFEKFNEIAEVKGLFELSEDKNYSDIQINRIKKLSNWYTFAKELEEEKMINDKILGNTPLDNEIKDFAAYIEKRTNEQYTQANEFIKIKEDCKLLFEKQDKSIEPAGSNNG